VEVDQLTEQLRKKGLRKIRYALAPAAVLLAALAVWAIWTVNNRGITARKSLVSEGTTTPGQPKQPNLNVPQLALPARTPIAVSLDLRPTAATRSVGETKVNPRFPIPARLVKLQLTLPFGSDDGAYEIEIEPSNAGAILKSAQGKATITHGDTLLEVILDLSGVPLGEYSLFYRHADASRRRVSITITN
jgi:hypothetical protein